ncbi:MAG: hypothetical protein IJ720_06995 [Clostridia bacterium]|nr:hypothetical protein [Clostridia bacterium]MBR1705092.1 hypothetical protein [Clostridia bacterium]
MAATGNRGAYDLNAYRNQRNARLSEPVGPVRGTAVPKTRPDPAPRTRQAPKPRVIQKTKKQLRQEAQRSRAAALRIIAIAAVLFVVLGFQIYSEVRVDELDQQLADINQQIAVVESDNTRRNMELNANVSLEKVDQYARGELGMVKISDYQVNYVKLSDADAVEVSGGKTHSDLAQKLKIGQKDNATRD